MKNRKINGVDVTRGSANVFADLGLPDFSRLKIKSDLVIEIRKVIREKKLTQESAAKIMKISQPKVSAIMNGRFTNMSEYKLLECLRHFGHDVEIAVKPSIKPCGDFTVAISTFASIEEASDRYIKRANQSPIKDNVLFLDSFMKSKKPIAKPKGEALYG